jgi:hypothetical protein
MPNPTKRPVRGLLAFSTRSYPRFGRQRKPFDAANPPQTVTDSPYYWWYQFLKLNAEYESTCRRRGRGAHSQLYKDFGDVFALDFKAWWTARDHLFAEPREGFRMAIARGPQDLAPFDSETVINLVVPLTRTRSSLAKSFKFLVLSKVERGRKGGRIGESRAKYRLSGKWHIGALATAYKVYVIKRESEARGERLPWADIAIRARIPMSYAASSSGRGQDSDLRRTLTILAMRHYQRAQQFIAASLTQSFPYGSAKSH